jgi:hypothetical protein
MAKHVPFHLPGSGAPIETYIERFADPSPWHPVDHLEPEDEEPDMGELGSLNPEGVQALLRWLIPAEGPLDPEKPEKEPGRRWRIASRRLAVLAHAIMPEIRELSETELARQLGCTRAAVSKLEVALRDWAGLSCNAGRSDHAREVYAERQRQCWRNGKRKRKTVEG